MKIVMLASWLLIANATGDAPKVVPCIGAEDQKTIVRLVNAQNATNHQLLVDNITLYHENARLTSELAIMTQRKGENI